MTLIEFTNLQLFHRTSVENAKEVQTDKSLKSKAEKDRRLREKHAKYTKIFIDERKTAAMKQVKNFQMENVERPQR